MFPLTKCEQVNSPFIPSIPVFRRSLIDSLNPSIQVDEMCTSYNPAVGLLNDSCYIQKNVDLLSNHCPTDYKGILSDLKDCVREPIYSVQQKNYRQVLQLKHLVCKLNYTDKCYIEYTKKNLQTGFGQMRSIEYEQYGLGKPSLIILSPSIEKDDNEITALTEKILETLEQLGVFRKRYTIVHDEDFSYIIGGYIFDPIKKERISATCDFKYDYKANKLLEIEPLPNLSVSFGIAIDGNYICVAGGHTAFNKPLRNAYIMDIRVSPEKWLSLPLLPAPTSAPGVGMINGEIHILGGFDILSSESIMHGEYLILKYPTGRDWHFEKDIEPIRARPLVLTLLSNNEEDNRIIYAAGKLIIFIQNPTFILFMFEGGYNINNERKPYAIPTIHTYDDVTKKWNLITTIPDFKLNHGLSFYENKLHISETIDQGPNLSPLSQTLRSYDIIKNQWIEFNEDERRKNNVKTFKTDRNNLKKLNERNMGAFSNNNEQEDTYIILD
ncbi:unnamed protein product [Didymodactylos carnosus]|uniref:Uncharacterized protein n=1 Tax=Didymodactylos carnosus TaxID=1234261 RepID=A0A814LAB7_9BILA|nr:unnamed protein product [Didymodactylos carnosus]CAF1363764.1 unnamed protein product [Didymodactylos carnosus]CAF3829073.1 unnamed protein product [Didymodactylos carnosus]CAF4173309.1 unnamed protein product [Didymodactylos carnosus]